MASGYEGPMWFTEMELRDMKNVNVDQAGGGIVLQGSGRTRRNAIAIEEAKTAKDPRLHMWHCPVANCEQPGWLSLVGVTQPTQAKHNARYSLQCPTCGKRVSAKNM